MFIRPRFVGKRVPPETNWRSLAAGHAALRPRIGPVIEQEAVAVWHLHPREAGGVHDRVGGHQAIQIEQVGRYGVDLVRAESLDRKSTRLNSSHGYISYAVFCLKKKKRQPAKTTT